MSTIPVAVAVMVVPRLKSSRLTTSDEDRTGYNAMTAANRVWAVASAAEASAARAAAPAAASVAACKPAFASTIRTTAGTPSPSARTTGRQMASSTSD